MPELPEVEFCRRSLERWTKGKKILSYSILDGRCVRASTRDRPSAGLPDAEARLAEVLVARPGPVRRHGKRMLWEFGDRALVLHLGMTGKWTRIEPKFGKLKLVLDDGPLWFSDPRLLGGVVPAPIAEAVTMWKEGLGPDAWNTPLPELTGKRPVKVALMDQSLVAGLGNVQAMEALWRAGIHPARLAHTVVGAEHRRLSDAVQEQLRFTLNLLEGEEEITYVEEDAAANPFPLYQRQGTPCPKCSTLIERMVQSGRGTWWCSRCQPA